ncbi:MAG: hypothetical protein K2X32_15315, partial [Phycisphaerales bacterium]|nr:hypothetical protein [Phycisphaerales bacterium]
GESVRVRWRLLQDFQLAGGVMTHGSHALAIEAGQLTRPTLSLLNATVPELIAAIGDDAGPAFAHAVAAVQVRLRTVGAEGGMRAAEAEEIIKALLARYQREGPTVRAFLLLRIPNITATVAFATGVKAIADSDASVVMAKIVTRCSDASDPWLKALSEGTTGSPVANIARLHAQRLRAGAKCFATLSGVRVDLPVDAPAPAK